MPMKVSALLYEARRALGVGSQGELGVLLGSSRRSGQRWETGRASPSPQQLVDLAAKVLPKNRDLAELLAQAAGTSLIALGLVSPPAGPAAPPPLAVEDVVDSVVCAAAEAMRVTPGDVRPALLAAFTRARRLGLGLEAMERVLASGEGAVKAGA